VLHSKPCAAIPAFDAHKPARKPVSRRLADLAGKHRADVERIVAGLSLTAGGVLGVMVAGLFR